MIYGVSTEKKDGLCLALTPMGEGLKLNLNNLSYNGLFLFEHKAKHGIIKLWDVETDYIYALKTADITAYRNGRTITLICIGRVKDFEEEV